MGEAAVVALNPQVLLLLDLQAAKAVARVPREAVLSAAAGRRRQQHLMGVEVVKPSPFRQGSFLLGDHLVAGREARWLEHGLSIHRVILRLC